MMNKLLVFFLCLVFLACGGKKNKQEEKKYKGPEVTEDGRVITFYSSEGLETIETEDEKNATINAEFTAPAKVAAIVQSSHEGASEDLVLFDDPELAGNYTQLIQHQINIKQIQNVNIKHKKIELERFKDLEAHGSATGRDVLEAQAALSMELTHLNNERAALIEHETRLKLGGFDPEALKVAKAGTAYIICDIPENQISEIKERGRCIVQFVSYPDSKFDGIIEDVADIIDNTTRMIKIRIRLENRNNQFKTGMFASVSFGVSELNKMSIPSEALITVKGKNYVFVKTGQYVYERREVSIGAQLVDRIVVNSGLKPGDKVVKEGVMQLKGLSFGY